MRIDPNQQKLFEAFARRQARPLSPWQKIVGSVAAIGLFGLALVFSVVVFAVVLTVGAAAGAWFWWKTRALRKQMREAQPGRSQPGQSQEGLVIEGEVIREVDESEPEAPGPRSR
ncbi:hypothetical protein [Denitromonas iodatirespirans]|uniref:DUF3040 domain-containing protein n=1 Tax=Denitromonas iodatirespirans TaxID=2795389 RepID=A0A944D7E1_DENI1|nr:hypothetical protein [Denitromonas iodatirespirans]MBT0961319.1 hypothetical protein [Denitromonas iodatirespirans]